ncbi:hypothetical protein PR003_g30159 [Phytophthora rubi]|uniref:Uncharacterized protein n=1 Tax=Phytophthora rubi TaxID=129364 RepID=A0A6A3HAD9_9STRA|nr:hypothetical protein PR002_g28355 [Phytophthora rubi]KAE9272590.1 hypothetical protein PR003_g30159 [Phytophthora rubi]
MNADLFPILPTEEEANINLFPHEEVNFVSPEPGFFMEVDDFFVEEEEYEETPQERIYQYWNLFTKQNLLGYVGYLGDEYDEGDEDEEFEEFTDMFDVSNTVDTEIVKETEK